jgi:hypothetical protein
MSTYPSPFHQDPIPVALIGQGVDLRACVVAKARAILDRAGREAPGWSGPPYDPLLLAEAMGIPVDYAATPPGCDAMLIPDRRRGFRIVCRAASRSTRRARFTIAHELSHTFFDDAAAAFRMRSRARHGDADPEAEELERLCDAGAAELLMPADAFREDARASGGRASSVVALAERYEVSLEAAALRFVELDGSAGARDASHTSGTTAGNETGRVVAAGFFEFATRPSTRESERRRGRDRAARDGERGSSRARADARGSGPACGSSSGETGSARDRATWNRSLAGAGGEAPREVPAYRARRVFATRELPMLFPPGKSVPPSSVIYRASIAREELTAVETFALGGARETLGISATAVRDGDTADAPPLVCAVFRRVV